MPRGKRRTYDERIRELQKSIDACDEKRRSLDAEMEQLLTLKRNEEVGELRDLLETEGLTVNDVKQLIRSEEPQTA